MNGHASSNNHSSRRSVTFNDIENAHKRISSYINETPVFNCSSLNTIVRKQCKSKLKLYFKCENFQKTGSFKVMCKIYCDQDIIKNKISINFLIVTNFVFSQARGALNALLQINPENCNGVITHSSGNHGQALAWAASVGLFFTRF